jgi:hypothetical protein
MPLAVVAEPAPLSANKDDVILVGKTRITLDTVVAVFNQGATAAEIVYRFWEQGAICYCVEMC